MLITDFSLYSLPMLGRMLRCRFYASLLSTVIDFDLKNFTDFTDIKRKLLIIELRKKRRKKFNIALEHCSIDYLTTTVEP